LSNEAWAISLLVTYNLLITYMACSSIGLGR
jgi:hypothetical protein